MSGVIVEVSARRFAVPYECPCCGANPDAELWVPAPRGPTGGRSARGLVFPYCKACLAHVERWDTAGLLSAGIMVAAIAAALVVALLTTWLFGLLVVAGAAPVAYLLAQSRRAAAKAACGPSCAGPARAVAYLGWSGNASAFSFASLTYTARFAEQNANLVNVSGQLRRLVEGHKIARTAAPTPAAAAEAVPAPMSVREWVARIESARLRTARRHWLQRALDVFHEQAERDELVRAACKLELAPVHAKLEKLATPAQKRDYLREVMEEVQADNIPQVLQDAELRELEALRK